MFQYDTLFYEDIRQMKRDEKIIMPLVMERLNPCSVVDFGCGEGLWLAEALRWNPKAEILGIDGDYVKRKRLRIREECFMAADLTKAVSLGRKFELAISTEVAEHLEEEYADIFLDSLTAASDQILFSAAVPGQGGTHHVNEKWQSYWISKFERRGFYCDTSLRDHVWGETGINSWRRQNLLFFSRKKTRIIPGAEPMDVIHPEERVRVRMEAEKNFEERVEHFIRYPEIYAKLDQIIAELASGTRRIVIYPYGLNGWLCERILVAKYGIKDYLIADNRYQKEGKKILTAKDLAEAQGELVVIDTCGNPAVHREVLRELKQYVDERCIYSAYKLSE